MQRISREDLRARLDAGSVTLVEALPESHHHAEHLPCAVNPPGQLTADLAATYCSGPSCGRSKVAADAFTRLGYVDVRGYEGSKTDWAEAGLRFEGARAIREAA